MLQAPCHSSPVVYGQSHYKKFWLRQTETEDDTPLVTPGAAGGGAGPQHVANCSQKFSPLSSNFTSMGGTSTPSPSQNQGGSSSSCKAGPSAPSSSNASLAACANSFNSSRKLLVSEYDLNHFEDSSEPGAIDCTLSLGTVKRERSEGAAAPTVVSRSGSPAFGEMAHAFCNPESTWTAFDTQILFNTRNFPSDCTRDLYPQTTVPARQSRLASGTENGNHLYCGSVGSAIAGTKTSSFPRPKKSPVNGAVEKGVVRAAATDAVGGGNNCNRDSYRALVPGGAIGLCRSSSWIPSLVIPESGVQSENLINKFSSETPSPFSTSMIASPLSGHSSVNGDESRFHHRSSSVLDTGGNGASSSAKAVSRTCAHCNTQKTPLWRNGPNGPKSLCNACGIRFKKAGKKNPNNGSSSELGSSLPPSPHSVKLSPTGTKAVKRKKNNNSQIAAAGGLSKQSSWGLEDGTGIAKRGYHQPQNEAPHAQPWKRNRSSTAVRMDMTEKLALDVNDTTTSESNGSEEDENETGGSSGNSSCLTWQHQRSSLAAAAAASTGDAVSPNVLLVPSASSFAFATVDASDRSPDDDFTKMNDVMSVFPYKRAAQVTTTDVSAEDSGTINAEEAALCLMKLSHGFGHRL
ncbi:hypothetical protein R1flu_024997 [Riccia fluitans]|uniref:GATA-type domain-containing protein n=1 Tax=Riccia fluitans TaxID=41844 RepID=A0ABD1XWH6_9MARC